jgi:MFS family permease
LRDTTATALLSLCLVINLLPLMTFPAVLPEASEALDLSPAQAGWVGGIYFAGYTIAVFGISSLTDRHDPKRIYLAFCLLGAAASLGFMFWATGFWTALAARFLGGVAVAGVHMPGLALLRSIIGHEPSGRSTGIYASCYALGNGISFVIAGLVDAEFGWRATFLAATIGPVMAACLVWFLPIRAGGGAAGSGPGLAAVSLRPLLANRRFMAYVIAFAGNAWEVFAIRVWFVAYLSWSVSRPGDALDLPPLALVSGLAALLGVPVSIAVSEFCTRNNRKRVIRWICWISVAVCGALSLTADAPSPVVLGLLVMLQITSFADVGALTAGAAEAADPGRRGAALGLYAAVGFLAGWLGPVAVGMTLRWFGMTSTGWATAFAVIGLGSLVAGWVMRGAGAPRVSSPGPGARE